MRHLHNHLPLRHQIPHPPEFIHGRWRSQRYANVMRHGREVASDADLMFQEMVDDVVGGFVRVHHYEVCVGVDGLQHAGHGLIEEFLAVVGVAFYESPGALGIGEGRTSGSHRRAVQVNIGEKGRIFSTSAASATAYPKRSPAMP